MAAVPNSAPHVPVLLRPILDLAEPIGGIWLDGTFGAGGYSRALLEAGAERVIAIDQDPEVFIGTQAWARDYGDRLELRRGNFAELDRIADVELDGVVLDIGVSSMQIDQAGRGFSFAKDGPLDMRMSQSGTSAADLVNTASESGLADIFFHYGEERAARRIARAIVTDRVKTPFTTTRQLAGLLERILPRPRPGQPHPATRSFQALRIAVNDELAVLARGLMAAERALKPGGVLAVVTFHSLEDRIVKRFLALRSGKGGGANRFAPATEAAAPGFELITRKAVVPTGEEVADNVRARSAKLRMARRTDAPAAMVDLAALGLPKPDLDKEAKG